MIKLWCNMQHDALWHIFQTIASVYAPTGSTQTFTPNRRSDLDWLVSLTTKKQYRDTDIKVAIRRTAVCVTASFLWPGGCHMDPICVSFLVQLLLISCSHVWTSSACMTNVTSTRQEFRDTAALTHCSALTAYIQSHSHWKQIRHSQES